VCVCVCTTKYSEVSSRAVEGRITKTVV